MYQYVSAEEAISVIKSGDRIFSHGSACTPNYLLNELANQSSRFKDIEMVSITQQGAVAIARPEYKDNFHINSLFVSTPVREAVNSDRGDFVLFSLAKFQFFSRTKYYPWM